MPAAKISVPQQQALDTLAEAGGVMRRHHLLDAVWRATSGTVTSLIKRDLLVGDEPRRYPRIVQLTGVDPATVQAIVWDEARREHEHRFPVPRTVNIEVQVRGYRPLTVANDCARVVLTTYTTGPVVFTGGELQNLDHALSLARSAAATHRPPHTPRPAPKVVA
jgi:hypothetical protein